MRHLFVSKVYLLPASRASQDASPQARQTDSNVAEFAESMDVFEMLEQGGGVEMHALLANEASQRVFQKDAQDGPKIERRRYVHGVPASYMPEQHLPGLQDML